GSALLLRLVGFALLFFLALPLPADAQYFGRNKVQYDDFDFQVLNTDNFDLHFYDRTSPEAIRDVGRMAERWYERLGRTFQHAFRSRKPLVFYANQPDFQQTNTISGSISQGTGGVTEGLKNRVILPFAETYGETDHVLGHELVHAFQYDLAQARTGGGLTAINRLPLWVVEGLA
ncbi:MAG: peptidase S9, partial [Gemmatimonadetes bacterium]|nr:peptidase S9 [Gemmatimonadota bacterium]NIR80126.1 peptidase S9 [Gemmatimonadota bacterium]NIT88881.1 peptidase S9 [Gemmatimonadota bacterium]NIU32684.1 peptidase S9 [Gemmatimonadota bacterium]NIU37120.1 peptidase S9 [Gemmatimonadota bacterium]